jgi:hypothetical protein
MPELEHKQSPEPSAEFTAAVKMVVHQFANAPFLLLALQVTNVRL